MMKKTLIKITMLVLAVVLAVGAVMAYYRTKVAPPQAVEMKNPFDMDLRECVDSMKQQGLSTKDMERFYHVFLDRVALYLRDTLIDGSQYEQRMFAMLGQYMPRFQERSEKVFNDSAEWNESRLFFIEARSAEIKALKNFDGETPLVKDTDHDLLLTKYLKTISSYRSAWLLVRNLHFSGIDQARQTVAKAREYSEMEFLPNCKSLRYALARVPQKLEAAHYAYLNGLVARLAYYGLSSTAYETLRIHVNHQLMLYKNNAAIYGKYARGVDALFGRAAFYARQHSSRMYMRRLTPQMPSAPADTIASNIYE